jgi:hypothetical protein
MTVTNLVQLVRIFLDKSKFMSLFFKVFREILSKIRVFSGLFTQLFV